VQPVPDGAFGTKQKNRGLVAPMSWTGAVAFHPLHQSLTSLRMNGKKFGAADHSDPTCLFELLDKSCFSHALPATAGVGGYNFT